MPNKDKLKKNIEIDFSIELAHKNEQRVETGKVLEATSVAIDKEIILSNTVNTSINGENKTFDHSATYNLSENSSVTLNKLREVYLKNNNSVDETYNYLKNEILQNSEDINGLMMDLCGSLNSLYDKEQNHKDLGSTAKEMLDKILSCQDGERLKGFVCMGIQEFGMKLLHDCNIPAVILCGKASESNHATLLYQRPDGKFAYNNYNESMVIDAPSLLDAIKTVYKQNFSLESSGYISIIDENNSYQKFAFEQEALWANELDKTDYNHRTPFTTVVFNKKSGVSGRYQISNLGNMEAVVSGDIVHGKDNKPRQTSISMGYKQNKQTALFNHSSAVGMKIEHSGINIKNDKNSSFYETKAVVQYINGEKQTVGTRPVEYKLDTTDTMNAYKKFLIENNEQNIDVKLKDFQNQIQSTFILPGKPSKNVRSDNVSTFVQGAFGKKFLIKEKDDLKLENSAKASLNGGCTFSTNAGYADARLTVEDGLNLSTAKNNWEMQNSVNIGYVADLKMTTGEQKPGIQSGVKANAYTSFMARPNQKFLVGAGLEASVVALKPYQEYGVSSSLFGSYKLASDKNVYAKVSCSKEMQNINIGGFSGGVVDECVFGAMIGTQLKNTNVYLACNKTVNKMNRTYDNITVAVGGKVNF